MLGDAGPGDARQHSTGGSSHTPGPAVLVNSAGLPIGAAIRHHEGANYCFADGHVKWLKSSTGDPNIVPEIRNPASIANSAYPGFATY
jgi:prepilin-type processing-associated H-X9-DG protein